MFCLSTSKFKIFYNIPRNSIKNIVRKDKPQNLKEAMVYGCIKRECILQLVLSRTRKQLFSVRQSLLQYDND